MTKEGFIIEMDWFTAYYDFKLNKTMAEKWFELSKKVPQINFHQALNHHILMDESSFFPSFGKISKSYYDKFQQKINSSGNYIP